MPGEKLQTNNFVQLMWQMGGLGPMQGQAVHFNRELIESDIRAPPRNVYSLSHRFHAYEDRVRHHPLRDRDSSPLPHT